MLTKTANVFECLAVGCAHGPNPRFAFHSPMLILISTERVVKGSDVVGCPAGSSSRSHLCEISNWSVAVSLSPPRHTTNTTTLALTLGFDYVDG